MEMSMYPDQVREMDSKNVVLLNGRLILSDRLHIQDWYKLKRRTIVGNTEFFVYAPSSTKVEVVDDLIEVNCQVFKAWAASPIQ